ncbi:MAG: hypothetical protein HUJ72_08370 [Blautia sp.]|mgnify:CR=1 FL=1|nr:hypothetical protein [Blautia sp.]
MIMKGLLAVFWLLFVPCFAGALFNCKKAEWSFGENYAMGYLVLFALMELMALAATFFGTPLHILTIVYGGSIALAAVLGAAASIIRAESFGGSVKKRFAGSSVWFWMAVIVILIQVYIIVRYAHMDEDDSFFVATATTSVYEDSLFRVDPYTGFAYTSTPSRYILSPFPIFIAVISQLTGGLHAAITAHVILPAALVPLGYVVWYMLAKKWFPDNKKSRGIFLFLSAIAAWFSAYSIYNSDNFHMVRIWQGKALLASFLIPYLYYMAEQYLFEEHNSIRWWHFLILHTACCLVSSMSLALAPLVTGIFVIMALFRRVKFRKICMACICCLPEVCLGIIYLFFLI